MSTHRGGTRRTFLAQIATAALLQQGAFVAEAAAGPKTALKTDVPLDRLLPELEDVITKTMAMLNVPGLSVALFRDAEISWTKGFGVKDKETGDDFLALRAVAQMWKPQVEAAEGISWGLGVGVEHTPNGDAFWHWGNNGSRYNCFVVAFPSQQIGLVVLTNSGNGLKACAEIVPAAIGGDHHALRWKMVVG